MAVGRISLSVYDANGGKGQFLTHVTGITGASTVTEIATATAAVVTAYEAVGTAGIKEAVFSLIDTTGARAPQADASVPSGAVTDFDNATDPTIYGLWIPSFLDSLLGPGRQIDLTQAAMVTFVTALQGTPLGGKFSNAHYVALRNATKAFRSARKLR